MMTELLAPTFPKIFEGSFVHWPIPDGKNRASGTAQISAMNDAEAVLCWLSEYTGSPNTVVSYRKEAERFMLWLAETWRGISDVSREDILRYTLFLADPQPAVKWCGPRRARTHAEWKPFVHGLQPGAVHHTMLCLQSMFSYLVEANYLKGNPVALSRKLRRSQGQDARTSVRGRLLEGEIIERILAFSKNLTYPDGVSLIEKRKLARARFVMAFYLMVGARSSEGVATYSGDLVGRRDGDITRWYWCVVGKGGKRAEVPIPPALLPILYEYRVCFGVMGTPSKIARLPLLLPLGINVSTRTPMILDRKSLYRIIKGVLADIALELKNEGRLEQAEVVSSASPHWLRHAYGKWQVDHGIELRNVMRNLRHSNMNTTMIYVDDDSNQRHKETESIF
ncbi:tyrosine-type recombinase/integrase [Iodobacter fluviatilis]|nr:site-specific integrase [Iodobacter fluviatilis]